MGMAVYRRWVCDRCGREEETISDNSPRSVPENWVGLVETSATFDKKDTKKKVICDECSNSWVNWLERGLK